MSSAETIPVAITARNESNLIGRTLRSIQNQESDERYHFAVTVAASACDDNTAERAQKVIDGFESRPDISYQVKEISQAGKNHAINRVLSENASDDNRCGKFIYGDGDAAFSSNCLRRIAETLDQPEVWVCGPVSRQIIHPDVMGTPLGNIQRARQLEVAYRLAADKRFVLPIGRLMGFRRGLLGYNQLPHNALSEDRYLTLIATQRYGPEAVKTILNASVFANAAQTIEDFKQTGDRIATVRRLLVQAYPELGNLLHELTLEASRRAPPPEKIRQHVIAQLIKEDIDPACLDEWHRLKASAQPRDELMLDDGTWRPALSTK